MIVARSFPAIREPALGDEQVTTVRRTRPQGAGSASPTVERPPESLYVRVVMRLQLLDSSAGACSFWIPLFRARLPSNEYWVYLIEQQCGLVLRDLTKNDGLGWEAITSSSSLTFGTIDETEPVLAGVTGIP